MKHSNKPKYKQIIDAAVIVIAENGYHQAQVSKIAKQARVADGTIYLYFKNKEDILVSLFREKMGSFIMEMEKEILDKQTASEKLFMLIEKHFTLLAANHKLAIVTQLELRQSSKHLRHRINEILKRYLDIVDDIISFGKQAGEFDEKLNSKLARQMIFGTIDETVTTWVMNEQKYNLIELAKEVHELLIWGFRKRLFEI
ncbi:TetR/AcrR family transcriptional regulator [Metabacillus fastidiosus]|uniref:TetR/AcrR family transcriptional regulator n=1 Tax=Metabacillus fastidiosus TaxID=1458 RepID=UPI002DB6CCAE|nr:TetR/AcrR family transcriptional regulator [Metabacillus fastidiosus]MEC2076841.1 TetR/AcrR family transcriptional regulator [Metabacillus fastidiosus]